jgi:M6 family metalloprotease-like protein
MAQSGKRSALQPRRRLRRLARRYASGAMLDRGRWAFGSIRSMALTRFVLAMVLLALTVSPALAATPTGEVSACKLPATTGWHDEGHDTDFGVFLRPTGLLRAVMLFVDFPNARATQAPASWRKTGPYSEWLAPAATWLRTASYGKVRLSITPVERWYRMSRPDLAYGMDRGLTFDEHVDYITEAVALADDDVDFSQFEIVYIVTPKNATGISHSAGFIDASDQGIQADGVAVTHGATFGQSIWEWGPFGYRVLAHETGHIFGLPDLYAYRGDVHQYVGGWNLMGSLGGSAPDLFAWEKWKLGWVTDDQVACLAEAGTRRIRLTAVERSDGTKLVVVPTGPTAAYVIESRRALGTDADACSTGVLVYRVDSTVATGFGPVRVVDATRNQGADPPCTDLEVATFGMGGPSGFRQADIGLTVRVLHQTATDDLVYVTLRR